MTTQRRTCAFLALLVSCSMAFAQKVNPRSDLASILAEANRGPYQDGELLVKFKSPIGSPQALATHRAMGATVKHGFAFINVDHVALPQGLPVTDAIVRYMRDPNVEYAEPNYLGHLADFAPSPVIPNDPYFGLQWAWQNTGQFGGISGADISATLAWDITTGSRDVAIAIVDTGIDYNHPDLKDNITVALCQNFSDATTGCDDYVGHGTHVAGIVGAAGNNRIGVTGLMWNANLIDTKIVNDVDVFKISWLVDGIDYLLKLEKKGINVSAMNMSFGIGGFSKTVFDACAKADAAGILIAAAAGNAAIDFPLYPAAFNLPNIISVAATDPNDQLAYFSDFGSWVDVAAPGVDVLSTFPTHPNLFLLQNYGYLSGTSMSTPMVSGLAGLLATEYPYLTHYQIRSTILRYTDAVPATGVYYANGRINAYKAVSSLLAPTNLTSSPITPSGAHLSWTDNATGEDGYLVERSTCNGPFSQVAVLGPDQTSYKDSNATATTAYTYRVAAFNNIAQSQYSNQVVVGNLTTCTR